ncbi:MAG: hypothetical protein H8F28_14225 [Fibrella sp.]|nr:hypothetical protein [Armatimonadota bacterium]
MELTDLIRMNQLIRGRIDLAGFNQWHESLPPDEQATLLYSLHLFGQQAGGREQVFEEAVKYTQLPMNHPLVNTLSHFRGGYIRDGDASNTRLSEQEWLTVRQAEDRRLLLPVLVYFFGFAENKVYSMETAENCNHWWHRDLLDDRVVEDLLGDPEFYRTAMRDDPAVKSVDSRSANASEV